MGPSSLDVAASFGDQFAESGYGLIVRDLAPGDHDLAVFAFSSANGAFLPPKTVTVQVQ